MFFFATRARERDLSPASMLLPDFLMMRFFPIYYVFSSLRRPDVIVLRTLAADRQMLCVPRTAIRFYILEPPDIAAYLPFKLAFEREFLYGFAERGFFFCRKVFRSLPGIYSQCRKC